MRGRVTDFRSGEPTPGARVRFTSSDGASVDTLSDATGAYALDWTRTSTSVVPQFVVSLDGTLLGDAQAAGSWWRGDLLSHGEGCISRYGVVYDAEGGRPVASAVVTLGSGSATTDADGWYRIDLGCPADGPTSFSTSFVVVSHPRYALRQQVVGRGISGVLRLDLGLSRN